MLSKRIDEKNLNESLEAKNFADRHWEKTFEMFKENQIDESLLVDAMNFCNFIDNQIINIYGLK